ncbi:class I SAM-dependent methyltransferase [Nocardioides donggukensis]|uniref:Methyltransferase domain-containing protein n=1 Tax=Nocardioides donggukensis TaxID=2774019 RepID=A0A927K5F0_9ACTN|nr:class I SAM-dependent methyltransferase [Nocardioides donggukensis]MBD8870864.1 methyltransferase domain-containing protein [Nocardioides donggukensis]
MEEFSDRLVVGWVSVPADLPPTRVSLHLGSLVLASTFATVGGALSAPGTRRRRLRPANAPRGDRRRSDDQIRTFSFRVRDIWQYVDRGTRITVRVEGQPLPISGHGMFLTPPGRGQHGLERLREKLEEGYVLTQFGEIALSKRLDVEWQRTVLGLHARAARILADEHGLDLFIVYGTLLGAVREGGFIGHDADYDTAYVSRHRTAPEVALELEEVAMTLIRHGLEVDAHPLVLHVSDPEEPQHRIDVFHTYFDLDDRLRFPFGVASTHTLTTGEWAGTREIEFAGGRTRIPADPGRVVAMLYGDDWRRPKPGFNWNIERLDSVPEAGLSQEQRTRIYWSDFYSRTRSTSGSTFFEFVDAMSGVPDTVIDIGCGDGRDACAFGRSGRTVLGLDQSVVGIDHARERAASLDLAELVSFDVADVADVDDLGRALDEVEERADGPVLFYLRFFLHAIPESVQDGLLSAISAHARPGDLFAAEFRTDADAKTDKVHEKHYRRFQSAGALATDLREARGFEILHFEEGAGLSPYKGEDPVLCRIVGRRL